MNEAKALLEKYKAGTCSEAELRLVDKWLLELHAGEAAGLSDEDFERIGTAVWSRVLAGAEDVGGEKRGRVKRLPVYIRIAGIAAAVATIVFGVWFFNSTFNASRRSEDTRNLLNAANDIAPGNYGATITLANGQVIQLDSAKKGVVVGSAAGLAGLSYEDGSEIASEATQPHNDGRGGNDDRSNPSSRGNEGSLEDANSRDVSSRRHDGTTNDGKAQSKVMMIATTAKGQTYTFTLPDGTKVWLNADSKLEFPAQFSGRERKIFMQGEAYFVVKHNDKQPFKVVSKTPGGIEQVVEDIGTEFNINAYPDEPSINTTLVEGSAAVNGEVLKPNEQAILNNHSLNVIPIDAGAVVAWRNGKFVFMSESLGSIMRKVSRWYGVEVSISDELARETFSGSVNRFDKVSMLLRKIELTNTVHFKIEGRRIAVTR